MVDKNFQILYHWSNNTPRMMVNQKYHRYPMGRKIIFLTQNPHQVGIYHGKENAKYLYAIKVPKNITPVFSGVYDNANEIVLNEEDWKNCTVLGRVSENKIQEILRYSMYKNIVFEFQFSPGLNPEKLLHLPYKKRKKVIKDKLKLDSFLKDKVKAVKALTKYTNFNNAVEIINAFLQTENINYAVSLLREN